MSDETASGDEGQKLEDVLGPPPDNFEAAAMPTKVLENVLLRFLARIIHADGEVHPKEMSMLLEVAIKLDMPGDEARRILDDEFSRKSDAKELAAQLPETHRREAYAMGCAMAAADGDAAEVERGVLMEFAAGAEIPEEDATRILDKIKTALAEAKQAQA
jgi:uncharacterized tellurite resistance protein B-like protein